MSVDNLKAQIGGSVLVPGDNGYDDAREIFNAMIDRRPAVIVQCESAADIKFALAYAREQGLEVAVRAGGHSVAGASTCDDGLVIDVRRLNEVTIDADAKTASVGGGATWADLDRACGPYGLATTGGRVSTTGVAGLTLGGGSGWFERKFGLASDNLVSVDLVTADGAEVTASATENSDLFWALHGGGGNFGVATRLVFGLHELGATTFGILLWPPSFGGDLVRSFRAMVEAGIPRELGGGIAYLTGPPLDFVPQELQGQRLVGFIAVWDGDEAGLREVLGPLLSLRPAVEMIAEMPYADIQSAIDDPPGFRNYWSAQHLDALTDEAIDIFVAAGDTMLVPSPSQLLLIPWDGAVHEGTDKWPQTHRTARWVVHPFGLWDNESDDAYAISWARGVVKDLVPYSTGAVYLNFIGDEGVDRVIAGFGEDNYTRLVAVKNQYDPDNVFHFNHNIKPAS